MSEPSPSPLFSEPRGVCGLRRRDWSDYDSSTTSKRTNTALMIWATISAGISCACVVMGYFNGSRGDLISPFTNFAHFAALLCGLIVLVCTIITLVRRHCMRLSVFILLGVIGVWSLSALLIPRAYLLGLKNWMLSAMTADQMRVVAAKARGALTSEIAMLRVTRDSNRQNPEEAQIWQELSTLPGMANLGNKINVTSFEDGVCLFWDAGGWNIDWGVRINPEGVSRSEEDTFFWAWQRDIGFYYANR